MGFVARLIGWGNAFDGLAKLENRNVGIWEIVLVRLPGDLSDIENSRMLKEDFVIPPGFGSSSIKLAAVKKVLHPITVPEHYAEADLRSDPLSIAPAAGYLIVPSPFTIRLEARARRPLLSPFAVASSA